MGSGLPIARSGSIRRGYPKVPFRAGRLAAPLRWIRPQPIGGGPFPDSGLGGLADISWAIVGGGSCCFFLDRRRIPTAATAMTAAATTIMMVNMVESNPRNSPPTVPLPAP